MKIFATAVITSTLLLALSNQVACGQSTTEKMRIDLEGSYEAVEGGLLSPTIGGGFYFRPKGWPVFVDANFKYFTAPNRLSLAQVSARGVHEFGSVLDIIIPYAGAGVSLSTTGIADSLAIIEGREIDLPPSRTQSALDIGVSLVGGSRLDVGTLSPFVQVEAVGGGRYQSIGLTAGLSVNLNSFFSQRERNSVDERNSVEWEPKRLSDMRTFRLPSSTRVTECLKYQPHSAKLESENITVMEDKDAVPKLTVYVHLQTHDNPIDELRAVQDTVALKRVQERIFENVVALAQDGATDVVEEGLGVYNWADPKPYFPGWISNNSISGRRSRRLARFEEIDLWGFEPPALLGGTLSRIDTNYAANIANMKRMQQAEPIITDLRRLESKRDSLMDLVHSNLPEDFSSDSVRDSTRRVGRIKTANEIHRRMKLLEEDIAETMDVVSESLDNVSVSGSLNELAHTIRTHYALIMAIRQAADSRSRKAQVIIGAGHLGDFESLCRRNLLQEESIRLRFYDYPQVEDQ